VARIDLNNDRFRLIAVPEMGGGIADFSVLRSDGSWTALLRRAPAATGWFNDLACYTLAPWSNRIAAATFRWRGQEHRLCADWPDGTAIHGLVKDRPWTIDDRSPVSVSMRFSSREHVEAREFPWSFDCRVSYELTLDGFLAGLELANTSPASAGPMPAGVGFHPFFPRCLEGETESACLRFDPLGRYPVKDVIPVKPPERDETCRALARSMPLGSASLDDVFLGSLHGAEIRWPGVTLAFSCSPGLGHAVLYTGAPDAETGRMPEFFCLEPVSMVNDGFNLQERGWPDTGVAALDPGASLSVRWGLRVVPTVT
jgi:aldose 1-epimerase